VGSQLHSVSSSYPELQSFFESQLLSTGTTIVGMCCQDGVILGADSRSTAGPVIMDKNKLKIHYLSPKMVCCGSGVSAVCDHLSRKVSNRLKLGSINSLHSLSSSSHSSPQFTENYNMVNHAVQYICEDLEELGSRLVGQFIVGGVDDEGPKLFQIDSGAYPIPTGYCSLGSGSINALSSLETSLEQFLTRQSHSRNDESEVDLDLKMFPVPIDDAVNIVRQAVRAGMLNDLGSGNHLYLCVIKKGVDMNLWREVVNSSQSSLSLPPASTSVSSSFRTLVEKPIEIAVKDISSVVSARKTVCSTDTLGRRVWTPLTTRLVYKDKQLVEVPLRKSESDLPFTIELLPNE
jgi:20S proteasome subunit beta 2